jgi:hypothetical protein
MIIRRYLKLTYNYCDKYGLLEKEIDELKDLELPFKIELLPMNFPNPNELILTINAKNVT